MTEPGATLYVVEDDEGLNAVIQRKLAPLGLEVRACLSAADVAKSPQAAGIELWILDYDLAGVSALEIVQQLRAQGRHFDFLVLTGRGDENSAVQMMKIGARDYLVKSIDTVEVLPGVVTRILGEIGKEARLAEAERRLREYQEGLEELVRERTAELRRQTDLNEALIRNVPDAVFAFDSSVMLTRVNAAMSRLMGAAQGRAPTRTVFGLLQDFGNPGLIDSVVAVLDGNPVILRDVPLSTPGSVRSYDIFITPLHGEDESIVTGGLAYLHDITEAKAYSDSLRKSEQRLRTILETIPIPMAIISALDSRILFANPAFQPLMGARAEDLVGDRFDLLNDSIDRDVFQHAMQAEGLLFGYEMRMTVAGGRTLWILLSAQRITLEQEEGYLLSMMDISAQKRVEEELTEAMASLQQTQRQLISAEKLAFLGGLTAGIAHEIKNPLNFINNFALLSEKAAKDLQGKSAEEAGLSADVMRLIARLAENMAIISKHGRRIDSIVRNMLLHARGETGEHQPVKLNVLLQESVDLAYHGLRAVDEKFYAETTVTLAPDVDMIKANPQDLGRVFVNLATNAYQAVAERAASASADYVPKLDVTMRRLGRWVEIAFQDNGTGIPEANLEKVFAPFFTTKTTGIGTGLGLSLSYETVVHGHGGELLVTSKTGEFTRFLVRLPAGD